MRLRRRRKGMCVSWVLVIPDHLFNRIDPGYFVSRNFDGLVGIVHRGENHQLTSVARRISLAPDLAAQGLDQDNLSLMRLRIVSRNRIIAWADLRIHRVPLDLDRKSPAR